MKSKRMIKQITAVLLSMSMFVLSLQSAAVRAAMVSTDTQIQVEQQNYDREQIMRITGSDEAKEVLLSLGVSQEDVEARVANMTADEIAEFNKQINEMPAGASSALGVILVIFVILIVLDLLGATNIFPVIKPIGR
ncbi:PA2779 family protein [Hahella sp. HN01]|uniref:PA2779 family protein n=1 Tax=Hahella sp. HN01 TaxID=2847262 RepID=UPI001C1F13A5|nr:PA2779 family protein [Hahella sp. HN01]MBU6953785.1 PA2779 family protein [Hahella sp. HN01]